jgi:hypothetical protein
VDFLVLQGPDFHAGEELLTCIGRKPRSSGIIGCLHRLCDMRSNGILASRSMDQMERLGAFDVFAYAEADAAVVVKLPESALRPKTARRESRDFVLIAARIFSPRQTTGAMAALSDEVGKRIGMGELITWQM